MKKIFTTCLILLTVMVFAQDKDEVRKMFWESNDEGSQANEVPEKWKNESAVVLYQYNYFYYPSFYPKQGFRKRVKLQDQAAVKEFSEFSYKDLSTRSDKIDNNFLGIRIIKPDGKVIVIDTEKEAKKVDDDKKLAIANLEVGDIIDYYFYMIVNDWNPYFTEKSNPFKLHDFVKSIHDEEERTLAGFYPIMTLNVELQLDTRFFINLNSYNGAPEFVDRPARKGDRILGFKKTDIPKIETERWLYPMVALPCYKFQMSGTPFGKPDKEVANGKVKKKITEEDMLVAYGEKYRPLGNLGQIERFLKKKTFANDADKVRQVYYFTRHFYYTQYFEAINIEKANIFPATMLYKYPTILNDETEFIDHFMAFLKDNKIDYDIVATTARYNGPLDDLILRNNLSVMLRVNTTPEPVYLEYFTPFSDADQLDNDIENTDAFVLNVFKRKKVTDVEKIHLPASVKEDNLSKIVSTVSMDADMTGLKVTRESSFTGHSKYGEQKDRLKYFDYVADEYQKYETEPVLEMVGGEKKRTQYKNEYAALIKKLKEEQKEQFKKDISEEFDFKIEKYDYAVKSAGRFGKQDPFVYNEDFEIENNLVKKAGANYVVEIGKILSGQIEINEVEKARTLDVYQPYPRSFDNEIVFDIPDGYVVSGIEKLNKNVTNATGGFTSSAKLEGNKLVIHVNKYYSNYFEPNSNWSMMIDFLEAAYQFTQEKVLLKKA